MEIIQQWQADEPLPQAFLDDAVYKKAKEAGITSLESYVTWAKIEPEPKKIDFSTYDPVVKNASENGLKWCPFFILGPFYATPNWFRESKDSVSFKCLEHNLETPIQSIWNPHLENYVEHFLKILSEHFDHRKIESVLLGIAGNWGEALYPCKGDFYQKKVGFHTHPGWWAADDYAVADYRKYLEIKYKNIGALNFSHTKNYHSFSEIKPPATRRRFTNSAIRTKNY